jgi:hypothetical protein
MEVRDKEGFYDLLGVGPDASQSEIDAAYEKALHAAGGPGMGTIPRAAEQAYGVIGRPASRAVYDPAWAPRPVFPGLDSAQPSAQPTQPEEADQTDESVAAPLAGPDRGRVANPPERVWMGSEGDADPRDDQTPWQLARAHAEAEWQLTVARVEAQYGPRDPKGYYRELAVSVNADYGEIVRAYRNRLWSVWSTAPGSDERATLRCAFDVLSDALRRAAYDPAWVAVLALSHARRAAEPAHQPGLFPLRPVGPYPSLLDQAPSRKSSGCLGVVLLFAGLFLLFR